MPDNTAALMAQLDGWVAQQVMRPLDRAFASFLHDDGGEASTLVLGLAAWTSQQLGEGHICLDLAQAHTSPAALCAGDDSHMATVVHWWQQHEVAALTEALAHSPVVSGGAGDTPLVLDGTRLYLRRYWRHERQVAAAIRARLATQLTPPAALQAQLQRLFGHSKAGTDWQKIACALASRSALTLITGGPGTGKTTTVVRLLGLLQELALGSGRPLRIKLAAPTGKAAARLSASIGAAVAALPLDDAVKAALPTQPATLHKLLGRQPGSRQFLHHRFNPLHADLVVVDEASMIDLEMMASLLDALRPQTRLVLLGDKDQLASVEAGAVMGDLCRNADAGQYSEDTIEWIASVCQEDVRDFAGAGSALAQQTAMLRHSHRFQADSGIGALAQAVNGGDTAAAEAVWRDAGADLHRLMLARINDPQLEQTCVDGYRHYLETLAGQRPAPGTDAHGWARTVVQAFSHFQLLCAVRKGPAGVSELNLRIAQALHQAGLIERADGWYEGRPVMISRNDYQLELMNGDVGITLAVPHSDGSSGLRVAFVQPDGSVKLVLPSRLDHAETVFAMTVHKSQGSEFDHAALVLPAHDSPVVTRELLYTAITRARQQFTLLAVTDDSWQTALQRPTRRASGLAQRVHQDPAQEHQQPA